VRKSSCDVIVISAVIERVIGPAIRLWRTSLRANLLSN
jgi:hypothetical protein